MIRPNDDWADPEVGWDDLDILDIIGQQAGSRHLTPEMLQMLSDEIYRHPPDELGNLLRKRGCQVIAARMTANGYQAIALLHPGSNTVVIVNRGTEFNKLVGTQSPEARSDLGADYNIFLGKRSDQLWDARAFLHDVVSMRGKDARFIVTGHSLGGALAQMQLAASYLDGELSGLDISGVTFAALGALPSIEASYSGRASPQQLRALRTFATGRFINYRRLGDGLVVRAKLERPG